MKKITSVTVKTVPEEVSTISIDTSEKQRYGKIEVVITTEKEKEGDKCVFTRTWGKKGGFDALTVDAVNRLLWWTLDDVHNSGKVLTIPVKKKAKYSSLGENGYLIHEEEVAHMNLFTGEEVNEKSPIDFGKLNHITERETL